MPSPNLNCLLIGMQGGGAEESFIRELADDPPPDVSYSLVLGAHESLPGARCRRAREIGFNRLVHPVLWPLPGLRSYAVDERFDLVHVHIHLSRLRLARDIPVLMSVSNSYFHYIQDYLQWEAERVDALYERARRICRFLGVANEMVSWKPLAGISVFSEFAKSVLVSRGVPRERVTVIPPGFAPPDRRPGGSAASDEFTVLFAGRDPRRKGADLVIESIRRLRREGLPVRGVIAGDESFLELATEPGFEAHPWITRRQLIDELFPRADAFVMPSRAEGYGFALVEAMSHGLPVISTTYGSIPEVVEHGVSGLLVEPGNGDALTNAMRELVADRAACRDMGSAGRRRFDSHFTRELFLHRMRDWYDQTIAGSRA
jgi:glycosyltransferase involved in cell wall biosynthesis